jgi:hypothetical protein
MSGCPVFFFFKFVFIYSHVHTLFESPHLLSLPLHTPSLPGRICSVHTSNFVGEKKKSNNKRDKAFLLLEVRIAIQRDS